jgi:hypothetical protein
LIYFNAPLAVGAKSALQNGATRRVLTVVNKLDCCIVPNVPFAACVQQLRKGNHSFVFLNPQTMYLGQHLYILSDINNKETQATYSFEVY